jgi:FeS assembly protein SufD
MSQTTLGQLGEDGVRKLSESMEEPGWLTDSRLDSFRAYQSLAPEPNPLYSKYAATFGVDVSGFGISAQKQKLDFRTFFEGFLTGREHNILLQGNGTQVHGELDEEHLANGVLLMPLADALTRNPALVRRVFDGGLLNRAGDKYAAFAGAFFNVGTLVYVPRGVTLSVPLRRIILLDSPKSGVVDKTFIWVEEEARLVFLEELYSRGSPSASLVASSVDVHAGPGSQVDFSSIQLLDGQAVHVSNRAVQTLSDSKATVSALALGASVSRSRMNFHLDGRGSSAEGFEIFFTDSNQRYDFETNLLHNAPDSSGSTHARGVLKGQSQSIFKGMIKIVKGAKNSRSYLAHHAMLLERTARSDAIPGLEIDNNEVKATHSAAVAQIDEEQLFYLMSRGLPLDEARRAVVLGFFEPVLSRVPVEQTREGARFMIEGKWAGERRRLVDRETLLAKTGETTPEAKQTEDIFERHYKYR